MAPLVLLLLVLAAVGMSKEVVVEGVDMADGVVDVESAAKVALEDMLPFMPDFVVASFRIDWLLGILPPLFAELVLLLTDEVCKGFDDGLLLFNDGPVDGAL